MRTRATIAVRLVTRVTRVTRVDIPKTLINGCALECPGVSGGVLG